MAAAVVTAALMTPVRAVGAAPVRGPVPPLPRARRVAAPACATVLETVPARALSARALETAAAGLLPGAPVVAAVVPTVVPSVVAAPRVRARIPAEAVVPGAVPARATCVPSPGETTPVITTPLVPAVLTPVTGAVVPPTAVAVAVTVGAAAVSVAPGIAAAPPVAP